MLAGSSFHSLARYRRPAQGSPSPRRSFPRRTRLRPLLAGWIACALGATPSLSAQLPVAAFTDDTRPLITYGLGCAVDGDRAVISEASLDGGPFESRILSYRPVGGAWELEAERQLGVGLSSYSAAMDLDLEGDRLAVVETDQSRAYLLTFDGTQWDLTTTFLPDDPGFSPQFRRVALEGDRLFLTDAGDDEKGSDAGALYVYDFDGVQWNQTAKHFAFSPLAGTRFGVGLAVWDGWVAVADLRLTQGGSGVIYLFRRQGGSLIPFQSIEAQGTILLGVQMDGRGNRFVASATETPQNAAVVLEFTLDDTWVVTEELRSPAPGSSFGQYSIRMDERLLAVGDPLLDRVHLFRDNGVHWLPRPGPQLPADYSDPSGPAYFGSSLDLQGDRLLVTAYRSAVPTSLFPAGPFFPRGSAFLVDVSAARRNLFVRRSAGQPAAIGGQD